MKTKLLVLAAVALGAGTATAQVAISVGNRGWCPPVRPICPPVSYCPPVAFRPYYNCPPSAWYSWGPSLVVSSVNPTFSNVSPLMNYPAGTPVTRVPAPVPLLPGQPVTVYPTTTFGWRR